MSVGYTGKTTNLPREINSVIARSERESMMGEIPGEIVSFDKDTQTASIRPLYRPIHNGVHVEMPILEEVPVRFPRAGNGGLTFPVSPGDKVTLRPMMRSTEGYHTDGTFETTQARSMSLSDMEAFVDGGESLLDPIPNFDDQNVHMRFDPEGKYGIKGNKDGKIEIDGSQGELLDLLATVIELLADDKLVINYGSSAGTGHQLEHRDQYLEIAQKIRGMKL